MAAAYPNSVFAPPTITNGDTLDAADPTRAYDEIVAMQQAQLTDGIEHNWFPQATGDARTLGTSSKYWGLSYLKAVSLLDAAELTIASGAVVVTQGYHKIDTEGDAASDDLDTLTATGLTAGFLLILRAENTARVVTVKDGSGNLLLNGDFALSATDRQLLLIYDGTNWREIARSVPASEGITSGSSKVTQIAFNATQSASADANTLDDYEEGTFTPGVSFGGGTTGITYGTRSGHYVKIGKNVWFKLSVVLTAKGSSTGAAKVTGLTPSEGDNVQCAVAVGIATAFTGLTGALQATVDNSGSSISLRQGSATGNDAITDTSFTNTSTIELSGWYRAAN